MRYSPSQSATLLKAGVKHSAYEMILDSYHFSLSSIPVNQYVALVHPQFFIFQAKPARMRTICYLGKPQKLGVGKNK